MNLSFLETSTPYFSHYPSEVPRRALKIKKLVYIKSFQGNPTYTKEYIEEELYKLSHKLKLLLHKEKCDISLELLYRSIQHLVELNHRDSIFDILNTRIKEFLFEKLHKLLRLDCNEDFFFNLESFWTHYSKKVLILKNLLVCYDRSSKNQFKFNIIQSTCLDFFKNIIILNPIILNKVTTGILSEISRERFGKTVNGEAIKSVLSIFIDLKIYEIFQDGLLVESKWFFQNEARNISEKWMSVGTYLEHVQNLIESEESRDYIIQESIPKVLSILYTEMIGTHLKQIIDEGFQKLMDEDSFQTLKLMYHLFSKTEDGVKLLAVKFQKYMDFICQRIVNSGTDKNMIQELMDVKEKLDKIIRNCFQEDRMFSDIIKSVLVKMIRMKNDESGRYLAKYLDSKLRSKNLSEDELEDILNKVMVIFRLIQGKDIFEAFYRKDLAKRLILGRSTNQDMEQSIMLKLKSECGESFSSKIEGMLTDFNSSKTINDNFKAFLLNNHRLLLDKSDVHISALTSSFWAKSTNNLKLILPDELLTYQDIFCKYYATIHSGRKLDWQPNLGHCVLRASFGNTVKELSVSLFQTIVLLLFNDHDQMSLAEIHELTKLDSKDLITTLHSLSCSKTKILIKNPEDDTITVQDTFRFNTNFTVKLFRIKINQAQLKETAEEVKATQKSVLIDRQFQIDAAIVRILKNKKALNHNELLGELFKILNIPVRPQDLKKRIELLVEREYIKRDFENVATYTYIA